MLLSLDLSAAFDTKDHANLIKRLQTSFGICGQALEWMRSYITDRRHFVRIGQSLSNENVCHTGVPQGSVLGPLLCVAYVSPLSAITRQHGISQHHYADDTQLSVAVSTSDSVDGLRRLEACLIELDAWFFSMDSH